MEKLHVTLGGFSYTYNMLHMALPHITLTLTDPRTDLVGIRIAVLITFEWHPFNLRRINSLRESTLTSHLERRALTLPIIFRVHATCTVCKPFGGALENSNCCISVGIYLPCVLKFFDPHETIPTASWFALGERREFRRGFMLQRQRVFCLNWKVSLTKIPAGAGTYAEEC